MKKLLFLLALVVAGGYVFAQQANDGNLLASNKIAEVQWEAEEYDFGTIPKDVPVSHEFKFTNTGDTPLLITNVKASCGCTATNYPKNPVAPGESASITATYNAKSVGSFHKTITVYTNAETAMKVLKIKGVVE